MAVCESHQWGMSVIWSFQYRKAVSQYNPCHEPFYYSYMLVASRPA